MSAEGTVKWFDDDKGFVFIEMEDSSEDAFVHHSDIQMAGFATLQEGQRVSFELTQGDKGPKALNVMPLDESDSGAPGTRSFGEGS